MSLLRLTRRLAPIVGGLSLAVLLAAGPFRAARAQEVPSEEFISILGMGTSDTGRFTVINGSATTQGVDLEALSDDGDIGLAFGSLGGALVLAPGQALQVDYTVTNPTPDPAAGGMLRVTHAGGLRSFLEGTVNGHRLATVLRKGVRATTALTLPWDETANGDPGTLRVGLISRAQDEVEVTVTVRDLNGGTTAQDVVMLPPGFPMTLPYDLGDTPSAGGSRSIEVTATGPVLADAILSTDQGATFITNGRALAENNQFWFPYVNTHGVALPLGNITGGNAYNGELRVFDPKGNVLGNVDAFTGNTGSDVTVTSSAPVLPIFGALCVDIRTGVAPRAPATLLRGPGDFAVLDPMRRIAPGSVGVAPFSGDDAALIANSVVLVNNPDSIPAFGQIRLRAADGRVLAVAKLKLKPLANGVIALKKLSKKTLEGVYLEIVNPPSQVNPKGGGAFQAAVISTRAVVAHKKKSGVGDTSGLASSPFLPVARDGSPTIVAAKVEKADDDKKGFLTFDGLAAGTGRKARLRMLDTNPVLEWKVKRGRTIKLKLKAKSIGSKQLLSSNWQVGETRQFVLIDDATNAESEPTEITRGDPFTMKK